MTTPNPKHLNLTPRAFLASLTPPLAILTDGEGRPARGRFSKDGNAALDKAREDGFLFLGDAGNENNPVEEKKERKAAAPKPAPVQGTTAPRPTVVLPEVNPKDVRAWAKQNGHEVGERGRIHKSVIQAYLAGGGKPVVAQAKRPTPNDMPKVRPERVGYAVERNTLIALTTCATKGGCGKAIQSCTCSTGPVAPHYLDAGIAGTPLALAKPVV